MVNSTKIHQISKTMKNTNLLLFVISLLFISAINQANSKPLHPKHKAAHSATVAKASAPKKTDSWQPDPTLATNLADETQVGSYFIRLPFGYSEIPQPPGIAAQMPNGFDNHEYGLTRRSDGTSATIALSIATPPPGMTGSISLGEVLDGTLTAKKQQWQNFTESPAQDGEINGLSFKRAYYKGIVSGRAGTRMAHGLVYVAVDGTKILSYQAEDVEPYNEDTLSVAQASILTFHRQETKQ